MTFQNFIPFVPHTDLTVGPNLNQQSMVARVGPDVFVPLSLADCVPTHGTDLRIISDFLFLVAQGRFPGSR